MDGPDAVRLVAEAVAERLDLVRTRMARAGGEDVTVVAVTKGFGPEALRVAGQLGLRDVGENYVQEAMAKIDALGPAAGDLRLHLIGQLQRNKVRAVAGRVALYQSVDRASLVDELASRDPGAAVLVQLNLSGEDQKGGCPPDTAPALVDRARAAGLEVRGLMGVGPAGAPEAARPGFRLLVALADDLGLPVRSIGMTADLEVAVEEGSTMVRIGRALFGPRS